MSEPVYADDITKLLHQLKPHSIILLDPDGTGLCSAYLQAHPECELEYVAQPDAAAQLGVGGRYDLCIVANTLEYMDKISAGQLIARLRDLLARQLFVVVPVGEGWPDLESYWAMSDFIGFGMHLVSDYEHDGRCWHMYKFDLADYKLTPDWLNARYWAHPERWDKERW